MESTENMVISNVTISKEFVTVELKGDMSATVIALSISQLFELLLFYGIKAVSLRKYDYYLDNIYVRVVFNGNCGSPTAIRIGHIIQDQWIII